MSQRAPFLGRGQVDAEGQHAGRQAGPIDNALLPLQYVPYALGFLALVVAASLGVGIAAMVTSNNHEDDHYIRTVCNRGSNAGTGLPASCPDVAGVPGLALVTAEPDRPNIPLLQRFAKGPGINFTSFPDSHIEIGALVVSNDSQITVNSSGAGGDPIRVNVTFEPIPEGTLNVLLCGLEYNQTGAGNVSLARRAPQSSPPSAGSEPTEGFVRDKIIAEADCENATNLWIEFPHTGHGLCAGDDHTCPNDGTIDRSSILGGLSNTLTAGSARSTIGGGTGNTITDSDDAAIWGGRLAEVREVPDSVIIASRSSIIATSAGDGTIMGGNTHGLDGDDGFIGGGESNNVDGGESVSLGGAFSNIGEDADHAGLLATFACGVGGNSQQSTMGGGFNNNINNADNAGLFGGTAVKVNGSDYDDTLIAEHTLVTNAVKTTGYTDLVSDTYAVSKANYLLLANTTTLGATTISIPDNLPDGMNLIVKDTGAASGATPVNVTTTTEDLCNDGVAGCVPGGTVQITSTGAAVHLVRVASVGWLVTS